MDERVKKLEEIQKKQEEIRIAKMADRLMVEGGTDSDPAIAKLENDGNVSRQLYSAVGHETLQSGDHDKTRQMMENAKQNMPFHDNQSQFLRNHISED
jgi:Mn-dependent DtxR family transcriptional regulator